MHFLSQFLFAFCVVVFGIDSVERIVKRQRASVQIDGGAEEGAADDLRRHMIRLAAQIEGGEIAAHAVAGEGDAVIMVFFDGVVDDPAKFVRGVVGREFQLLVLDVRGARAAVVPCEAVPSGGVERLDKRKDVVAVGMAAEPVVDDEQLVRTDARPVELDGVVIRRGERFAVVRYVFFMAQIAWKDGLDMRVSKEKRGFVG